MPTFNVTPFEKRDILLMERRLGVTQEQAREYYKELRDILGRSVRMPEEINYQIRRG